MTRTPVGRSVLVLLAATCCWGASSAALAHEGSHLAAGAPIVAAGGAVLLCAVAAVRGRRALDAVRARPALYVRLGGLEAVNLALYTGALRLGPLPVIVALHLTSPVILIAADVARGRRPASAGLWCEFALIAGAIALVALAVPAGSSAGHVLWGSLLALASAAALALLISQVAEAAGGQDPDVAAALQLSIAAVLTAPLAVVAAPSAATARDLLLVGVVLLGPGFALYWRALRGLDAPLAGILGLNEALVASVVGALAFDAEIGWATLGAAALVLAAVALELRRGRGGLGEGLAGP
jgi:drug/metabolite transporter (DMT)-like permease